MLLVSRTDAPRSFLVVHIGSHPVLQLKQIRVLQLKILKACLSSTFERENCLILRKEGAYAFGTFGCVIISCDSPALYVQSGDLQHEIRQAALKFRECIEMYVCLDFKRHWK